MRILLVNSHHKILGGTEKYYLNLTDLLKSKGHVVANFSMSAPGNLNSKWSKYFVSYINLKDNSPVNFLKKLSRMVYSFEAKNKISKLLDDFRPDIVHINNIYYYITPSIFYEIKRRNIPIVQTVHDYELISPSTTLFYDGKVNEVTKTHSYFKALMYRRNHKYMATIMSVVTSYFQYLTGSFEKNVDCFVVPSRFMKAKMLEYGFRAKKIVHLTNFTTIPKAATIAQKRNSEARYVLYSGRIDEAKGIDGLIEAAKLLPRVNFKIAGSFVEKTYKWDVLKKIKLYKLKNMDFVGFLDKRALNKAIQNCEFTVFTSQWYENQPYSLLESMASGRCAIASDIGGVAEIIKDKHDGLLYKPGDINDLSKKIGQLWNNKSLSRRLGNNSIKTISQNFGPENHYKKLVKIYTDLCE